MTVAIGGYSHMSGFAVLEVLAHGIPQAGGTLLLNVLHNAGH